MDTITDKNGEIADSQNNYLFLISATFQVSKRLMHEIEKVIKLV